MVKTLMKHEIKAVSRGMLPVVLILLGMAFFTRILQFFESNSDTYDIVFGSAAFMLGAAIVISLIMSVVVSVKRFYTNMFTGEGYLTMTLPVTVTEHILTKLAVAVLTVIVTVVAVIVAISIATMGEVFVEIVKSVDYLAEMYFERMGGHGVAYIFEVLIAGIVLAASQLLLYYACISLGQRAKKNRVAAAFGCYFAYYVITQILGTVLIAIVANAPQWLYDLLDSIENFAFDHPFATVHYGIWGVTLFYGAQAVAFFFISRYIIKNKLNLE